MGFNERLKQIRKEKGLTQAEVAAYVGLKSSTTYSSWEQGVSQPDLAKVVKLANLFDVSVDYLLGLTDNKRPAEKYYYSGEELKNRGLRVAEMLEDADFLKFTQKMKAENITPEYLEKIVPLIIEMKKYLQD